MNRILASIAVALLFTACAKPDHEIQTQGSDQSSNQESNPDFKLKIETTEFIVNGTDPIEVPYTVSGTTESTVVGVTGYDPASFYVSVEADKIVVTPLKDRVSGDMLAYADSRTGKVSLVNLCFESEFFQALYAKYSTDIDFVVESAGGNLEMPVLTNMDFEINSGDSWIHGERTKADKTSIVLSVDENPKSTVRTGSVYIFRKETASLIMTVVIAQNGSN